MIKTITIPYLVFNNWRRNYPTYIDQDLLLDFKNYLNNIYYRPLGLDIVSIYENEHVAGFDIKVQMSDVKESNKLYNFKWSAPND